MKRVAHEPAFVLHRYAWSETSLIVEVFTRHHGRVALAAKGARRPSSSLRPILLPLQPLQLAFSGDGEVRTLKACEWAGGHVMPGGDSLLAGTYANELLMRLLPRDDANEDVFDAYARLVDLLGQRATPAQPLDAAMRAFELLLLRGAGVMATLDTEGLTHVELNARTGYRLVAEAGLRHVGREGDGGLIGERWQRIDAAMACEAPFEALRQVVGGLDAAERASLRHQLRDLLHYHCGVGELQTRRTLKEIREL